MAVLSNTGIRGGASGVVAAPAGYNVKRSARFNKPDSAYMSMSGNAGNRQKWTWSCWIKRNFIGNPGAGQSIFNAADNPTKNNTTNSALYFHNTTDKLYFGGWNSVYITSHAAFRDPSAWYHITLVVDTAQSTQIDRIKLYVNNVLQTYDVGGGFPGQNTDLGMNQAHEHRIGGNCAHSGYSLSLIHI